jgi:multifunctional methyltransferase subunit TRM112
MKILTLNFLTCARKACKASPKSFPLHPADVVLELVESPINPPFLTNILPRLDWPALRTVCAELGLPGLADEMPDPDALWERHADEEETGDTAAMNTSGQEAAAKQTESGEVEGEDAVQEKQPTQLAQDLHRLLLETTVKEGKLVCENCGHQYAVMDGIANFLLPAHLV